MKKFAKINLILMVGVILISLFQSVHIFSHKYLEAETHIPSPLTNKNKGFVITQGHENCSICDFNFAYFVAPTNASLRFAFPFYEIPYYFSSQTTEIYFSGAIFVLRGPPAIV